MSFYPALLRLYPRSFRVEYADELERTFELRTRGRSALASASAALSDVVPNALAAHWELLRQDLAYAARTFDPSRVDGDIRGAGAIVRRAT